MTTKKTNEVINVTCPNCGAELTIKNGKPAVKVNRADSGQPSGDLTVEGVMAMLKGNPDAMAVFAEVSYRIKESGYLDVKGIVRRWIPSQCLHMINSRLGFHGSLVARKYDYCWTVLLNDLKKQAKFYKEKDTEGLNDRNRWYNKNVAVAMAEHFIYKLDKTVKEMKYYHHGKKVYVKIRCKWLNQGKGVHINEMAKLFDPLEEASKKIQNTTVPSTLYEAASEFYALVRQIKWTPDTMCVQFTNAYKAAGAYYTMKDLIMFENCLMKVNDSVGTGSVAYIRNSHRYFVDKEKSLKLLEDKAEGIAKAGSENAGYEMLGLLKDFLEYNHFDYDKTFQDWADQSAARRATRRMRERRSRK